MLTRLHSTNSFENFNIQCAQWLNCYYGDNCIPYIVAGNHTIRLEVSNCPGSPISDLATGFYSNSRFIIQELPDPQVPPPLDIIDLSPTPPSSAPLNDTYQPIWRHCVKPGLEEGLDNGTLNETECTFVKSDNDTVVKVTWDGSLRVLDCR